MMMRSNGILSKKLLRFLAEFEEREADHVVVITFDRLHQRSAESLYTVSASLIPAMNNFYVYNNY